MTIGALLCVFLGVLLVVWLFMVWRGFSQDWLPAELKAARLVGVEEELTTDEPYPVVGRPDQVYRLSSGAHVPLELKNRNRDVVFETDIAEISLRAWLLRKNGMPTAQHGYVAINNRGSGKRVPIRVELRDDAFCERLIARYLAVSRGDVVPRKSRGRKCDTCGHYERCHNS